MEYMGLLDQINLIVTDQPDLIFVENVILHTVVGLDCWQREKEQRVILSCSLFADTRDFHKHDDFTKTVDYRSVYNAIKEFDGKSYSDIFQLARNVATRFSERFHTQGGLLEITLPKAIVRCEGGLKLTSGFDLAKKRLVPYTLNLSDIKISCIIGINPHERLKKQPIVVQLKIFGKHEADDGFTWRSLPQIFDEVINVCKFKNLSKDCELIQQ
jgi:dihydroneopterin aldolase / 2-amino-4-hydroxy-6-hydroxymethyldihydropteridine diphosphokinase / dihydropteroate synthase